MTEHPPTDRGLDREIRRIALPVIATLAAEPLYDVTDAAIVGHLGTVELAGATLAISVLSLGYAVFIFLMFGTTATVARLLGAGEADEATRHGVQGLWLGGGLGMVTAALLYVAGPVLLSWFGGDGEVLDAAVLYLRVSVPAVPALLITMAGTGYVRGLADTRTPLLIAVPTVALNLVVELVLIYGFGFGLGASAFGTVVARWVAAIAYIVIVGRAARRRAIGVRPEPAVLRQVSTTAWPLFVRTAALRLAFVTATLAAGRLGAAPLAAYAVAFQIFLLMAYLSDGLEVAGQALVGRYLGSASEVTARRAAARIIRAAAVLGCGVGVLIGALRGWIPSLFTEDPAVREAAADSLLLVAAMQPINAVTFALDGILVGAGDLAFLAWSMLGALAVFVGPALALTAWSGTVTWLWVAMAVFMLCRIAALSIRFRGPRWVRLGVQ